jgi:hypothetical protein
VRTTGIEAALVAFSGMKGDYDGALLARVGRAIAKASTARAKSTLLR